MWSYNTKAKKMVSIWDSLYIPPEPKTGKYECTECKHKWEENAYAFGKNCPKCKSVRYKCLNYKELFGTRKSMLR